MRARDWRRAHKFRMRARAERILIIWGTPNHPYPAKKLARKMADNMQMCSRCCCGNPRRHFGKLTVQERKQKDSLPGCLL